jgi:hypothetical protein
MFDEHIYIPKDIEIHHINENVQDNSLINLQPLTKSEHRSITAKKDKSNVFCLLCGNKTRIDKKGYEGWCKYLDGYICNKCYMKEYRKNKKLK